MTTPISKPDAASLARLMPWVDLLAPKAPAGGGQTQSVVSTPRVDNDVLLPTRADLHLQEPAGGQRAAAGAPSQGGPALSAAARVIASLLADRPTGSEGRALRASAPVWTDARVAPQGSTMAAALAQQVSESGLFYESHLAQLASGTRSLVQIQREPQAALGQPVAPAPHDGVQLPMAAPQALAAAVQSPARAQDLVAMPVLSPSRFVGAEPVHNMRHEDSASAGDQPTDSPAQPVQHAWHASAGGAAAVLASAAPEVRHAQAPANAPAVLASNTQDGASAGLVHPQAAGLVHQQLDLLAGAMFRWSGEAWPGAAMEWSVQEEGARRQRDDAQPAVDAPWSTTVSLDLPRLGLVDVRLNLRGSAVRAQFASRRQDTLERLREQGEALSQRMQAAGLELQSVRMDTELASHE